MNDIRPRLLHIVTEYDRRQSKRKGYNPYALAHYCRAIGNVMEAIGNGEPIEQALKHGFCGSLLRHVAKKLGLTVEYSKFD